MLRYIILEEKLTPRSMARMARSAGSVTHVHSLQADAPWTRAWANQAPHETDFKSLYDHIHREGTPKAPSEKKAGTRLGEHPTAASLGGPPPMEAGPW